MYAPAQSPGKSGACVLEMMILSINAVGKMSNLMLLVSGSSVGMREPLKLVRI